MYYQWIDDRPLNYIMLRTMKLDLHFNTELFPVFKIGKLHKSDIARYVFADHEVTFNETYVPAFINTFTINYFHELAHSTINHTERLERLASVVCSFDDAVNLEERIADIVSFIFDECYNKKNEDRLDYLKIAIKKNKTSLSIPWQEVELATTAFLKDKNCSKIKSVLQLYKQVITDNNLCPIHEGLLNVESQKSSRSIA